MKTAVRYILAIAVLFLAVCWIFNHVSAWGSIFFAVIVVAAWLVHKRKDIRRWLDDYIDVY